jgi:hypothetical protein
MHIRKRKKKETLQAFWMQTNVSISQSFAFLTVCDWKRLTITFRKTFKAKHWTKRNSWKISFLSRNRISERRCFSSRLTVQMQSIGMYMAECRISMIFSSNAFALGSTTSLSKMAICTVFKKQSAWSQRAPSTLVCFKS